MPENPSFWNTVGAIGAVLLGVALDRIIVWLANRRGNRVVIARNTQSPQIQIKEDVEGLLQMRYGQHPVKQLVLNTLQLWNGGNTTIKNLELKLIANSREPLSSELGQGFFLDAEAQDPDDALTLDIQSLGALGKPSDAWTVIIKRPYLNPKRKYREEFIELAVFSNTELDFEVEGGGEDWRSKFKDRTQKVEPPRVFTVALFGTMALSAIVAGFGWLMQLSGLDATEILDIAKTLFFVFFGLMFVFGAYINVMDFIIKRL
jgi:hypothetical protein